MVLLDDGEKEQVNTEFQRARETLQRVKEEIRIRDRTNMMDIVNLGKTIELLLSESGTIYSNFTSFSEYYGVMDILGEASNYIEHDYNYFHSKLEAAELKLQNIYQYDNFKYSWKRIETITPMVNNSYILFERFVECLAGGLAPTNDPITTISPPTTIGIPFFPPWNPNPITHPQIFVDQSCDNDIFYLNHLSTYSSGYDRFNIKFTIDNIMSWYKSMLSIVPDATVEKRPEHQRCMDTLNWFNTTGQQTMDTYLDLVEELSSIIHAVSQLEESDDIPANLGESMDTSYNIASTLNAMLNSTEMRIIRKMIETHDDLERDSNWRYIVPETFPEGKSTQVCLWLYRDLTKLGPVLEDSDLLYTYFNSDHDKFFDIFEIFVQGFASTKRFFDAKVKPDILQFLQYLEGSILKLDLVHGIVNAKSIQNTEGFTIMIAELDKAMEDLDEAIAKEAKYGLLLLEIPINLPTPFIDYHSMNDTITGQQLNKFRDSPLTGYDDEDMKTNFQRKFLEMQEYHYDRIKMIWRNLRGNLTENYGDYLEDLREERAMLQTYETSTQMDEMFFM